MGVGYMIDFLEKMIGDTNDDRTNDSASYIYIVVLGLTDLIHLTFSIISSRFITMDLS